jgi:hypothetical protein
MMTCPHGHASVATDYCDHCGAPIEAEEIEEVTERRPDNRAAPVACPRCRAVLGDGDTFCEQCGFKYDGFVWRAIVCVNRARFERYAAAGAVLPESVSHRDFELTEPVIEIGRGSARRGAAPQIDLSEEPQDTAISHRHALLIRQDDGTYAVLDPGSTNGTSVNDDPKPIRVHTPVRLSDGDAVHIGAWTTITIRAWDGSTPHC